MSDKAEPLVPEGLGRSHGTSRQAPFDRWFRYPAGFSSDIAEALFAWLSLQPGQTVVDPFAGSAVTGTGARSRQLSYFGIEAHPEIAELGNMKLTWPPGSVDDLWRAADQVLGESEALGLNEDFLEQETELVRKCFEGRVLLQLIGVREILKAASDQPWTPWLKWALLGTLRDVAHVKVGWPYQRPSSSRKPPFADVSTRMRQRVGWMVEDLRQLINGVGPSMDGSKSVEQVTPLSAQAVIPGDAREPLPWKELAGPADGCLSSPPYLNNFDYADATRLEVFFWGTARTWSELCANVRAEMVVATTQQTSVARAESALERLERIPDIRDRVQRLIRDLSEQRHARPRGKEYDRVLPVYIADMAQVLEHLAQHLAPDAPCLWLVGDSAPYGVYIDTPDLLGRIAQEVGLSRISDITLRKRGLRWSSAGQRHQQTLTERLLWLRRSP